MLAAVAKPLSRRALVFAVIAVVVLNAAYCLVYNAFAGRSETLANAFSWGAINIVPWLLAFEYAKRHTPLFSWAAILIGALTVSLLAGYLAGQWHGLGFETVRRLPGLVLVAILLALGRLLAKSHRHRRSEDAAASLPCDLTAIEWIGSAGNYVELHGSGPVDIRRVSLTAAERALAGFGFVRIHRTALVRRNAIARIADRTAILVSGAELPIGDRYRTHLGG